MKIKTQKIEVSFNSHQFNLEKDKLQKICNRLNEALTLVKAISDNKVNAIDVKAISDYLNSITKFTNASMSADAMSVANEFQNIKDAEKLLKTEFIVFEGNAYKVNTTSLKEHYTDYLSPQATKQYEALNEACYILKELNPVLLQTINTNWSVNVQKLFNISNYLRTR